MRMLTEPQAQSTPLERHSDDQPPLLAQLSLVLVLGYVVVNRLIADIYTLPIGISLRPSDVVLALLAFTWLAWIATSSPPFPNGLPALAGSAMVVVLLAAPFINAATLSEFEMNGAERGLVRGSLYAVLFVATYHVSGWREWCDRLVKYISATTVALALMAIVEVVTGAKFQILGVIWMALGLEIDPRDVRGEQIYMLEARLTGETRASATSAQPLVLAGLLVIGIAISAVRYLRADSRRERIGHLIAILIQVVAVGATNQRTGFLALVLVVLLLVVVQSERLPRAMPLMFAGAIGAAAISVVSPATPRLILNFFTGQQTDHNVAVRMSKYDAVPYLLGRRPVIGPGYSTGDPSIILFDNAYITQLIEFGVVGFAILMVFLLATAARPFGVYRSAGADQGLLVMAMCASVTLFVTMSTFDVLSFDQLFPTCLIMMAIGLARADYVRREGRSEV